MDCDLVDQVAGPLRGGSGHSGPGPGDQYLDAALKLIELIDEAMGLAEAENGLSCMAFIF